MDQTETPLLDGAAEDDNDNDNPRRRLRRRRRRRRGSKNLLNGVVVGSKEGLGGG